MAIYWTPEHADWQAHSDPPETREDLILRHLERGCDERCSSCPACWMTTGETVCGRTCKHFDTEDE